MKAKFLCPTLLALASSMASAATRPIGAVTDQPLQRDSTELAADKAPDAAKRYPLRGVITAILADQSSLMIKHEDIPGLMRGMTMVFKVDEATARSAKVGQSITGMVAREGNTWWVHDARLSDAAPKKP